MIYDSKTPKILMQGDICHNLPKISSSQINFLYNKDKWIENIRGQIPTEVISFKTFPSLSCGVVLNQSCDIRPESSILFAELIERTEEPFSTKLKGRLKQIRKILHDETRTHYFPANNSIDILRLPKILDFKILYSVPYQFLHDNLDLFFVARLNNDALNVLREKISRFFTRLAFEDIMFLNNEEVRKYAEIYKLNPEELKETLSNLNRTLSEDEK